MIGATADALMGVFGYKRATTVLAIDPEAVEANRIYSYDPATGEFTWKIKPAASVPAGARAGANSKGYRRLRLNGRIVGAHRVAWLMTHGNWPCRDIDHINGNRSDNRIVNLREVDRSTNAENVRSARRDNELGVMGVRISKSGRFEARIFVKGKSVQIGTFDTLEEARDGYLVAKREFHNGCTI